MRARRILSGSAYHALVLVLDRTHVVTSINSHHLGREHAVVVVHAVRCRAATPAAGGEQHEGWGPGKAMDGAAAWLACRQNCSRADQAAGTEEQSIRLADGQPNGIGELAGGSVFAVGDAAAGGAVGKPGWFKGTG